MRDLKKAGRGTLAVWGGEEEIQPGRSTQVPVFLGAAHAYEDLDEWIDVSLGKRPGHIYGRNTNPTVEAFEEKVSRGIRALSGTIATAPSRCRYRQLR